MALMFVGVTFASIVPIQDGSVAFMLADGRTLLDLVDHS